MWRKAVSRKSNSPLSMRNATLFQGSPTTIGSNFPTNSTVPLARAPFPITSPEPQLSDTSSSFRDGLLILTSNQLNNQRLVRGWMRTKDNYPTCKIDYELHHRWRKTSYSGEGSN